eukprot:gene1342-32701_t
MAPPGAITSVVPEILAKRRKRDDTEKRTKANSKNIFKKAEQYVTEFQLEEKDSIRLKRDTKSKKVLHCPPEQKLLFVIRIKGLNKVHPTTKKIFQLLRLKQINMGVFIRVNAATLGLLKQVEPFIAFGYPNMKSVKELIYKRGYAKIKNTRIPLTDNRVIEQHLGKHGIICMEDLVHELITVGKSFSHVTKFLYPMKLNSPLGGLAQKKPQSGEVSQTGNQAEKINDLIRRMN